MTGFSPYVWSGGSRHPFTSYLSSNQVTPQRHHSWVHLVLFYDRDPSWPPHVILALMGKLPSDSGAVPAWRSNDSWAGPRARGAPSGCPGLLAWPALQLSPDPLSHFSLSWLSLEGGEKPTGSWSNLVLAFSPPPAQKEGVVREEKAPVPKRLSSYCFIRWWHLKIKYGISLILVHLAFTDVSYA